MDSLVDHKTKISKDDRTILLQPELASANTAKITAFFFSILIALQQR
jgi:hypothetical protein